MTARMYLRITSLLLLTFLPTFLGAAPARRRALGSPVTAIFYGEVLDAVTGKPVIGATVNVPGAAAHTVSTGYFSLTLPVGHPISLSIERSGYETLTSTVTLVSAARQTFRMTPRPTVRVVTPTGTADVDFESISFGWAEPFFGYRRFPEMNMCTATGQELKIEPAQISRITGPATASNVSACCSTNTVTGILVAMKNGQTTQAYFKDSCAGNRMELIGQDHVTHQFVSFLFTQIQEAVFP